jgi:hypothetical protein
MADGRGHPFLSRFPVLVCFLRGRREVPDRGRHQGYLWRCLEATREGFSAD